MAVNNKDRLDEFCTVARTSPILEGVAERALRELASVALCHDYPKNNILFYQGDPAGAVFLVISGQVKITLNNEEGKEVILAIARPGALFGLIPALDGGPQPATAITVGPSRLAKFAGDDLIAWMEKQRAIHKALLRDLGEQVRQAYQKIGEHALLGVKERLLYTLLDLAESEGILEPGGRAIVFTRPTHLELAHRIGSSREVVSRLLKELLEGELLTAEGRVIRVPESALVLREQ